MDKHLSYCGDELQNVQGQTPVQAQKNAMLSHENTGGVLYERGGVTCVIDSAFSATLMASCLLPRSANS